MASEFVCSVEKENKLGFYRIHSIWSDERLRVNIASKDASWSGEVTRGKLEENSKRLDQLPEVYMEECKGALTTDNGVAGITYAVEDGSFVWKKTIDEELGMKVQLGSVPLEPTNFVETIQNMMDVTLHSRQTLQKRLAVSDSERDAAKENVNSMFKKLEDCQKSLTDMENDLMCKMLAVLNAKKKKISELEQEITILRSNAATSKVVRRRKPKIKVEEDAYDVDTDEDMPVESAASTKPNKNEIIAGTSRSCTMSKDSVLRGSPSKLPEPEAMKTADDDVLSATSGEIRCHSKTLTNINLDKTPISIDESLEEPVGTCPNATEKLVPEIPSKSKDILGFFFGLD